MPVSMFCFGSGVERAVGAQVVLHEDEVPELEEAVARRSPGAQSGCAAAVLLAAVVDRSPSRGRTGPVPPTDQKLSLAASAHDPLRRHARLAARARSRPRPRRARAPGRPRSTVDPEPLAVELHVLGDELPGEVDRAFLEVVAEREVAEHLEERRWWPSRPTSSMSVPSARSTSGRSRAAARAAARAPRKYGFSGCMPADDEQRRAVVGARDQRAPTGRRRCPRSSKKERKPSRSSAVVRMPVIVGAASAASRRANRHTIGTPRHTLDACRCLDRSHPWCGVTRRRA